MKQIITAALAAIVASSAWGAEKNDSLGFVFTDIHNVKTTSVKNQNKSGTCWCFCGTSFFEDEIMRQGGDSLDLSEMYTVRLCYDDKADRFIRNYGETNFSQGGSGMDVAYVWDKYGAVPEEVYTGLNYGEDKHAHAEVEAAMAVYLKAVAKRPNRKLSTAWKGGLDGIMDAYFGKLPETFTYKGKTYTPKSYAQSLPINTADYVAVTSFTHQPFYKSFILEIPDNWINGQYFNMPLEEMKAIVDNALEHGYPVLWAADVSEPGFKWQNGVALMPADKDEADMEGTELARWVKLSEAERNKAKYDINGPVKEINVTQELRQQMYDAQETTDDHGMEIVGIATDQAGNRYYKVKNSWDTNQIYGGYIYVSEPYFLAKTMNIYVHKDAVPANLKKKMK